LGNTRLLDLLEVLDLSLRKAKETITTKPKSAHKKMGETPFRYFDSPAHLLSSYPLES
jgi:hypothetical protein